MDYQIILTISLVILVLLTLGIGSFAGNMQAVTLWAGKKIAPSGSDKELPRGFQDAITPKYQDTFNMILPISYFLLLVGGTIKNWFLGVPLLVLTLVLITFLRKLWPYDVAHYIKLIIFSMTNKVADYAKNGDPMRLEAGKEVLDNLENLYLEIRDSNMKIPDFSYIKKMPVGSDI